MLYLESQLGEYCIRNIGRSLSTEDQSHSLGAYELDNILQLVEQGFGGLVEYQVGFIYENDQLRFLLVSYLRKGVVYLSQETEHEGREHLRTILYVGKADDIDHSPTLFISVEEVFGFKTSFSKEEFSSLVLQLYNLAQNSTGGRSGYTSVL